MDPAPWVKGDVFDAVMHYQRFKIARGYFAQPDDKLNLDQFKRQTDSIFLKYPPATQQAMMNLASSHDSPRLLSSFFNINKYKFKNKPPEDNQYRTQKPGLITYYRTKLFLLHQFTFVGAPHIWNGDEMGMFGADDPDNRKPLTWPEIEFEIETQCPYSAYKYEEKPEFDRNMFEFYKSLIKLRKSDQTFVYGSYQMTDLAPNKNILAYYRTTNESKYLIIFNNNTETIEIELFDPIEKYHKIFEFNHTGDLKNIMALNPFSALVLKIEY